MPPFLRWLSLTILTGLVGCSPLLSPPATPTSSSPVAATSTQPADSGVPTSPSPPDEIVLWLPPRFDPQAEDPAADLFLERLQNFGADRPNLNVHVRLKSESGPGGLLETLRAANTAAPGALPDLVLLDPAGLNTAALKDLIVPLDGILPPPDEASWYPYALAAAHIDGEFYGYPLASDAIVLAYRSGAFEDPPLTWSGLLESDRRLLFPAGEPQALFTLAQYQAVGGALLSDTGRPALDPSSLSQVLAFYDATRRAGVLPSDALQYQSPEETWTALVQGRVHGAVSPLSSYLRADRRQLFSASPILTRDGSGLSIARTWSLAIVTQDHDRQALAADLIRWLHEPDFLGSWTESTGLLPPTAEALATWTDNEGSAAATLLVQTLRARPSEETLATFGPPLYEAVQAVLQGGQTPDRAALQAAQDIQVP